MSSRATMPFHDLNVAYTTNHADLSSTLLFHAELGYSVVAIAVGVAGKLPSVPQPVPVSSLTVPQSMTILTRLTLTISDASQNHRLASLQPHYDLISLRPTTEKAFQLCCSSLECDLISLDLRQRLPFVLKFKTVASALQRGVRFEICYSPGIAGGNDGRRNLISGAAALIRATRGRGIILSSEAKDALGVRGPYDVINLAQVWGLGQERGKESLCEEAGKVVRLAGLKRTSFRGVLHVLEGGNHRLPVVEKVGKSGPKAVASEPNSAAPSDRETSTGAERDMGASSSVKRKASSSSITVQQSHTNAAEDDGLSKQELKRRAKKARLEGKGWPHNGHVKGSTNGFPIKHQALSLPKKKN